MTNKTFILKLSISFFLLFFILTFLSFFSLNSEKDLTWYLAWVSGFHEQGFYYIEHDYPPIFPMYLYLISCFQTYIAGNYFYKNY